MANKSDNTQGNPWHDESDGKFTSPGNAGEESFNVAYDEQNINVFNPKNTRLSKNITNGTPFEKLNFKDRRSLPDYLVYSKNFIKNFGPQIAGDLSENSDYVNTMLSVKQYEDDEKGNDFFIFTKSGKKEGIDLKTFSANKGIIKISLKQTNKNKDTGEIEYNDGYYLNPNKNNKFYAFQACNLGPGSDNRTLYNEAQQGKDPSLHVDSAWAYFLTNDTLINFFNNQGLTKEKLRDLAENDLKQKLDDSIQFIKNHPTEDRQRLLDIITQNFGAKYSDNRIEQEYNGFKIVCEVNNNFGHPEYESYIELDEGTLNDIDGVNYYYFEK